jgi:hypothetical protein
LRSSRTSLPLAAGRRRCSASRRGVAKAPRPHKEAAFDQRVRDELFEVLRRPCLHAGRDLFGQEFEQKVGHGRWLKTGSTSS